MTKSNPDLRPESNRTGELVVEQYVGRHVRAAATAFHYTIDDLITQTTDAADGLLVYNNVERITARGIEVDRAGVSVRPAARLGPAPPGRWWTAWAGGRRSWRKDEA